MAERDGRDGGRSHRHRDCQLRAWHQHVEITVAMELAAALSARPAGPVVEGPRKVEAQVTNATLRGHKEPF